MGFCLWGSPPASTPKSVVNHLLFHTSPKLVSYITQIVGLRKMYLAPKLAKFWASLLLTLFVCLEGNSKYKECKNGSTSSREMGSFYQEQRTNPCHLSSSIYYGGQDVYTQNPATGFNSPVSVALFFVKIIHYLFWTILFYVAS